MSQKTVCDYYAALAWTRKAARLFVQAIDDAAHAAEQLQESLDEATAVETVDDLKQLFADALKRNPGLVQLFAKDEQ